MACEKKSLVITGGPSGKLLASYKIVKSVTITDICACIPFYFIFVRAVVCIMISDTVYYYASGCFFWYLVEVV
jgi:hypothetical protein